MAWRSIAITDVRLTPQESAAMQAIQASSSIGAAILVNVAAEFRAAIESKGGTLGTAGYVDDLCRMHVINRTRWQWLVEFPQLKSLQTEQREKLNTAAEEFLKDILSGKITVSPAAGGSSQAAPAFGERCRDFTKQKQDGI